MLGTIIRFALRYRMLVVLISVALLVYGSYLTTIMPIDVFPDLDRPRVVIMTECPGLATEEVELLVTQPIEVSLLGAVGVQSVRSQSTSGFHVIYVEFDWDTDIRVARQTVQERLATLAGVLPEGIRPQIAPVSSIMGQIVIAGVHRQRGPQGGRLYPVEESEWMLELLPDSKQTPTVSVWRPVDRDQLSTWEPIPVDGVAWRTDEEPDTRHLLVTVRGVPYDIPLQSPEQQSMALRSLVDWIIRPRVLRIGGVAEVFVQGGDQKQYQILVDPAALLEYDVTLQQVEQALVESNINTSGGFAVQGEKQRPIRILGRLGPQPGRVMDELRKIPVKANPHRAVLLQHVARIVEGTPFKQGDGAIDGVAGVVISIAKQPHADTRAVTDKIDAALSELAASLPADIVVNSELFRLKNFIDRGIYNVGEALAIGAGLVIVVLFLFLLNFRTTFITLTAIPLSLVITVVVFRWINQWFGLQLSINVMTLGGLAVAMGELVDDAIVDVENIFRRLKENNGLPRPRSPLIVVYEASMEIRSAIVFGTAVVILVFLPLFALSGVEGRLFAPLGIAYIGSILASLIVSLTITPVLSSYLLPRSPATHGKGDGFLLRVLKRAATPLIQTSMAIPGWLLLGTWTAVIVAGWQFLHLGRDFLPQFDEGSVQVNVTLPPGSSLAASNRCNQTIETELLALQATEESPRQPILHFVRRTGRAEADEHAMPVSSSEYILSMNPASGRHRAEVIEDLLQQLRARVPGVDIEVEQPLAHLISHMVSGVYAQIAIKVRGDDLSVLNTTAEQIAHVIQDIPGLTPPVIEPIRETEELHIRLRPDDLARYAATRAMVAHVMQTALQGRVVSQVLEGPRRFDLLVRLEERYRTDYANLGRLRIDLPNGGGQVELSKLADIGEGTGPNGVNRDDGRRRIVIRCNTQGRDLSSAVAEIEQRIGQQVDMPVGYFIEYGGQFESQQRATRRIGMLAILSVVGMFGVLLLLFPSVRVVLQILNALPTAFIGGVIALVITDQPLTVASLVGFISLGGIAVRNGILLVTHYFHLMKEEQELFSPETILRGSLERLAPVLMTAITAGVGLIPLVLDGQEPGREILFPVATVILGGLVTSTFCEFLIHPGLFWRFSGHDVRRYAKPDSTNRDSAVEAFDNYIAAR